MDVTALYTSIPIKDGLQALQYFLNQHNTSDFSTTSIVCLGELVLNNASFEFNGAYFRQISGISMGTKFGPSFACLFMGYLETKILETYTGRKPDLFKRYIDNCVGAASCSSDELRDFIDYFSNFHPAIKVMFDISAAHLPFLDILLSISGDRPATSVTISLQTHIHISNMIPLILPHVKTASHILNYFVSDVFVVMNQTFKRSLLKWPLSSSNVVIIVVLNISHRIKLFSPRINRPVSGYLLFWLFIHLLPRSVRLWDRTWTFSKPTPLQEEYFLNLRCAPIVVTLVSVTSWCTLHCLTT